MALNDEATTRMLRAFSTAARWLSLHYADPSADGLYETEAIRQIIAWDEPVGSVVRSSIAVEFAVPKSTDASFVGYWTDRYSGTCLGGRELPEAVVFPWDGTYRIPAGMLIEELASDG